MSWREVPAIDRNGIITQYDVMYEPLETFGKQLTTNINIINASLFEFILEDLEEYVLHNITVRAYTVIGEGPYSSIITIRTLEDSKHSILILYKLCKYFFVYFSASHSSFKPT